MSICKGFYFTFIRKRSFYTDSYFIPALGKFSTQRMALSFLLTMFIRKK